MVILTTKQVFFSRRGLDGTHVVTSYFVLPATANRLIVAAISLQKKHTLGLVRAHHVLINQPLFYISFRCKLTVGLYYLLYHIIVPPHQQTVPASHHMYLALASPCLFSPAAFAAPATLQLPLAAACSIARHLSVSHSQPIVPPPPSCHRLALYITRTIRERRAAAPPANQLAAPHRTGTTHIKRPTEVRVVSN